MEDIRHGQGNTRASRWQAPAGGIEASRITPLHVECGVRMNGGKAVSLLIAVFFTGLAAWSFGAVIGFRAGMFFLPPLGMIWFPDLLAKLPVRSWRDPAGPQPVSPSAVRLIGWFVLAGVPLMWLLFAAGL